MFKLGEYLTLLSDSFGSKKGDKVIYLWDVRDSGHLVALCVIVDSHYHEFMKNNHCYTIDQIIKELDKMNNRNSIEMRLNCVKPYHNQLTSKSILEDKKKKLKQELEEVESTLKIVNSF